MSFYFENKYHYWQRKLLNKNGESFNVSLINYKKLSKKKSEFLFKSNVEVINLETSSYCNRICSYCPVSIYGRKEKDIIIKNEIVDTIIKSLHKINYSKRINFNLYNEPLAHSSFNIILNKFREQLPNAILSTNSNGDYIKNLEVIDLLEKQGLKELKVTLHMPSKKKWNFKLASFYLTKFSKRINFNLKKKEIKELKFNLLYKKLHVFVHVPNWGTYGNSRGSIISSLNAKKTRTQPCVRPFREFTIYVDGSVTPCCDIYHGNNYNENVIGKIEISDVDSIFSIYSSKLLTDWRKSVFDYKKKLGVCATCKDPDLANSLEDNNIREKILSVK